MKLPLKFLAIAILALAAIFGSPPEPVSAADSVAAQAQADTLVRSGPSTSVDAIAITTAECQSFKGWVAPSVGKLVLNIRTTNFEPVDELAGYCTVIERPKINLYDGFANTRAREQV